MYVFTEKPQNFTPQVDVVGCCFSCQGKLLMLKRSSSCSHGDTWGLPAGKVEKGESLREGLKREVQEEVGLLCDLAHVKDVGVLYVSFPNSVFTFHMFEQELSYCPDITLSYEHQTYRWVTAEEVFQLPLIPGGKESLTYYFSKKM